MEQKHVVTHVEWSSPDPEKLATFLTGLFELKFDAYSENYFIHNPGDGVSIGVLRNSQAQPGGTPSVYIEVSSMDQTISRALELSGGVAVPKTEIPNMGWYAFLRAPEKNLVGLHESLSSK